VELVVESDRPTPALAVRLCDIRPDGVSPRVSYGLLHLTRRNVRIAYLQWSQAGSNRRPPACKEYLRKPGIRENPVTTRRIASSCRIPR